MTRETTIDLSDGTEEIAEEIEQLDDDIEHLKQTVKEEYDSHLDVPQKVQDRWQQLQEKRKNLIGQQNKISEAIEDWGGSEITITELTGQQLAAVQDQINRGASQREGLKGQSMNGARVVGFLQESVVNSPSNAPNDPGEWPWMVMLYVFEKVDNFNTVGETDFQQTTLKDAMTN